MSEIIFPVIDDDNPSAEGVVATWFVADGETVTEGQLVAEVAVNKATAEVQAPQTGMMTRRVAEGEGIAQGATIGVIS